VFIKTASYLFDTERFFKKWLHDMAADQRESGEVGQVIPDLMPEGDSSAAWGDAATICPWQVYQTYGDKVVLEDQFESMRKWVDFIGSVTQTPNLWVGHFHFGDWLGLDAPDGSYKGSSREDFIASAFYAHSTALVVKAGRLLGKDVSAYEKLHGEIVSAFRIAFPAYQTQTEHVLAVHFGLAEDPQKTADALAEMVKADGVQLRTGFVGTPYILHVLSNYGHADLAWDLVLRREYPSWLYPVTKGATTIWEHWDGIKPDGSFWSADMNSFNHYSLGAVCEWMMGYQVGIKADPAAPGYQHIILQPTVGGDYSYVKGSYDSVYGTIESGWTAENGALTSYDAVVPANTTATLYLPASGDITAPEGAEGGETVVHNGTEVLQFELSAGTWHFE
jgi:alpha-L-rhamnosidase